MAMEAVSVDEAVPTTTADLNLSEQTQNAAEEIGPSVDNEVPDGDSEVAPDDFLGGPDDSAPDEESPADEDEQEVPGEDVVEAAPEEPKEDALGKRATKRVQDAVNRAKAAEVQAAQLQQQYQQQLAYMQHQMQQQMAQQQAALQKQQEFYQHQAQLAAQRAASEDESKLTAAQRVERAWLNKAKEAMSPEIQRLRDELANEKKMREQVFKQAQQRQQLNVYKGRADTVGRNLLFKDFEPERVEKLLPRSQELLLTWGTAADEEPEQAAQGFKQFLEDYYQARLGAQAKKAGPKLKQAQAAPKPVPTAKSSAKGTAWPTGAELKKLGFDNHVQWLAKQSR